MNAQRAVALLITLLVFALVIFGLGALFATFDHRRWGYVVGIVTCAIMVYAGLNASRADRAPAKKDKGTGGGRKKPGDGGAGRGRAGRG